MAGSFPGAPNARVVTICTAVLVAACRAGSEHAGQVDSGASAAAVAVRDSARTRSTCYVSDRSVLARAPDTEAPGPSGLRGWIQLEEARTTDSNAAKLVDSDGFALDATWRSIGDSIVVAGFNDFVKIEMRLHRTATRAIGVLNAHSDAGLERDSTGKLREFRRALEVVFREAACDSMPVEAGGAAIDVLAGGTSRPGIRFDPSRARQGTWVGALVIDSIEARRTIVDSTYVGSARFRGSIELSGWTLRHPDPDLYRMVTCFEADSTSAARLPRWSADERRAWFCFENRPEAARALGPPSEGVPATIVIDRFTIHRGMSDEVNTARFVRLVRRGPRG